MQQNGQEHLKAHKAVLYLLKRSKGKQVGGSLILIHAEDQLMSAEGFKIIAEEMIEAYKRIVALEEKTGK